MQRRILQTFPFTSIRDWQFLHRKANPVRRQGQEFSLTQQPQHTRIRFAGKHRGLAPSG